MTRLQLRMHRDFQVALAPIGIEPPHFGILVALEETGSISQSALARHFAVSGAHMVQLVDELEDRSLVARRQLATDRRAHVIEVLPQPRAPWRPPAGSRRTPWRSGSHPSARPSRGG